ncbi:MAG: tetratricopeptide repeat protein [Deltaproteobacteria bacterium]|nr:tetratricopeptide repeat protein [Deltaproteobacteria bacterium]
MKIKNAKFSSSPQHEILLLTMLSGIIILIYAQTLTTPFIFDDISNIRDNPHIRVPYLSLKNLAWAGFQSPLTNRPVANISFALNYYVHGYNLVGYHVVNMLIHLATGLMLYFLVKATLLTPALRDQYANFGWIPFFTVFIWLVHPLQTQSVTYLVQRMNSMAAMFYVLSMLLYVKFRLAANSRGKWLLLIGCILASLLAFGTKEISATLPGFIILYEWFFFQGLSRQWARRNLLILAGLGLLIVAISLAYFENDPIARLLGGYNSRDFTMGQRVLTQFRIVIFYMSLLIWPKPSRLNLDHDFGLSYSLTNPLTTLPSIAIIITLIILAILIARREPLISYGILWFFGNLVIESSVIGLELVFEHRNYLPSMLAILGAVSLVFRYLKPAWLGVIALCVAGTLFTVWTYERNSVWTDELTLYRDCLEKAPGKARPHNNLGAVLMSRGRLAEAIELFKASLIIKPDYADAHYNLGYALSRQGDLEKGIHHFAETLRLEPENLKALNNMGVALALQGRYTEAADYLTAALKINPRDADVHNNLGFALMKQGSPDAAARHFKRALELDPQHAGAYNNFGLILKERGQMSDARRQMTENRRQITEDRRQRTEDRRQKTED